MDLVYSFAHLMDLIKAKNITFIYKRDGQKQSIDLEKISDRLKNLAFNLNHININLIIWKVV